MNMPSECSKMRSESSKYMWEDNGCFCKQLENQNSLGEVPWKTCTGSLGEKLDESWYAYYVVEHDWSKLEWNAPSDASWTLWIWWLEENSWGDCRLSTRNFAWVGTNPKITRRILERSTMDICLKSLCWLRARTRAKARGTTSPHAEELTRGDRCRSNKGVCVRLRNRKRLMEYIQKMFVRWVCLCLAWTSLWIQQARCLSQSWCGRVCHWSWNTTTSAEHTSKEQWRDSFTSDFRRRLSETQSFAHRTAWLCEPHLWIVRKLSKKQTQCRIVLKSKSRWENDNAGRLWVFVGWRRTQTHQYSSPKTQWTTGKNTWVQRFRREQSCDDHNSSLNQDVTLVWLDGRRSLILNKIDATRCKLVGPRQVGFCWNRLPAV